MGEVKFKQNLHATSSLQHRRAVQGRRRNLDAGHMSVEDSARAQPLSETICGIWILKQRVQRRCLEMFT